MNERAQLMIVSCILFLTGSYVHWIYLGEKSPCSTPLDSMINDKVTRIPTTKQNNLGVQKITSEKTTDKDHFQEPNQRKKGDSELGAKRNINLVVYVVRTSLFGKKQWAPSSETDTFCFLGGFPNLHWSSSSSFSRCEAYTDTHLLCHHLEIIIPLIGRLEMGIKGFLHLCQKKKAEYTDK